MEGWTVLTDVLVLLLAALILGVIAEQLRQSAVLGFLFAGALVGPHGTGLIREAQSVEVMAELGVALLLFTIGLEFSIDRLKRLGRVGIVGGTFQVLVTTAVVAGLGVAMGLPWRTALTLGLMIAPSSTACVLRLLVDASAIDSPHGRNSLGVLLLQDIAVLPAMLIVATLVPDEAGTAAWERVLRAVLALAVILAVFALLSRRVLPRGAMTLRRAMRNRDLPIVLAAVMAMGASAVAHKAGLSPALGAFVAGVLLGESPLAVQVRADVTALRALLVTLFFAAMGMLADPAWAMANAHWVALAVLGILSVKAVVIYGVLRRLGEPRGVSVATGACLAQVGEFSFVLASTAHGGGLVDDGLFRLFVTATIVTLFLTPFMIRAAPAIAARLGRQSVGDSAAARASARSDDQPAPGHGDGLEPLLLVIGFGPAGQQVATSLLRSFGGHLRVLDTNPANVEEAQRMGLAAYIGDATQREVLLHAGADRARVVVTTLPSPESSRRVIEVCREVAPGAVVIARARYHVLRWELHLAGAREVIDEEESVGLRLAATARRHLPRPELVRETVEAWHAQQAQSASPP